MQSCGLREQSKRLQYVYINEFYLFSRVEELMLSLDESSESLNRNLKEKEKENRNLERR